MWWMVLGCSWLTEPSPQALAASASMEATTDAGGVRTLARPQRLGAVVLWGDAVVWSVPSALLSVPVGGGQVEVLASLPPDCWPRELAVADEALFAVCGRQLLRVRPQQAVPVLEGDFVYGLVAGPRGVYTCRGSRLVRLQPDGETYETLADLGVVPHPAGGPAAAACVGAELALTDTQVLVRHDQYVWAVSKEGGAPQTVGRANRVGTLGTAALLHDDGPGRRAWRSGDDVVLETGLVAPCASSGLVETVTCRAQTPDGSRAQELILLTSQGPLPIARDLSSVVSVALGPTVVAWAEGSASTGGLIRITGKPAPQTVK